MSNTHIEDETCGLSSLELNIFGGTRAEEGNLPWMVSFLNQLDNNFCGGVLISRRHILTAAHCFDYRDWRSEVRLRLAQVDLDAREKAGTEATISDVKIHEK